MPPPGAKANMPKHLRFIGLQARTIRAYRVAVDRFHAFVRHERLCITTPTQLDYAVGEYLNALFQEGDSLAQGGHLLSGLKRFCPGLRVQLPTASQYYRNWQRYHRPDRAVPLSWDLLQALAAVCLTLHYHSVALMLYVGFFCFLRTSEMLSLQCFHLVLHQSRPQITVIIPFAKTSNGNPEVLTFEDVKIHALASKVLQEKPHDSHLWVGHIGSFRSFWDRLLRVTGFSAMDYSPSGIRRGGASWHFLETASMDLTLHRGRWSSNKVAKQYIDDGTLSLAKMVWSRSQTRAVKQLSLKGALLLKRLRQKMKHLEAMGVVFPFFFVLCCLFGSCARLGKMGEMSVLSNLLLPTEGVHSPLPQFSVWRVGGMLVNVCIKIWGYFRFPSIVYDPEE